MTQLQQLNLYQASANQLLSILKCRLDQYEPIRALGKNIYCKSYPSYRYSAAIDHTEQLRELLTF